MFSVEQESRSAAGPSVQILTHILAVQACTRAEQSTQKGLFCLISSSLKSCLQMYAHG